MKSKIVITVNENNEISISVDGSLTQVETLEAMIYSLAYTSCLYTNPAATKDEVFISTASAICTELYNSYTRLYSNLSGQLTENVEWTWVN